MCFTLCCHSNPTTTYCKSVFYCYITVWCCTLITVFTLQTVLLLQLISLYIPVNSQEHITLKYWWCYSYISVHIKNNVNIVINRLYCESVTYIWRWYRQLSLNTSEQYFVLFCQAVEAREEATCLPKIVYN